MVFKKNGRRVSYDLIIALLSTVIVSSVLTVGIIYWYLNNSNNIKLIQTGETYLTHLENSLEDPVWTLNEQTIAQVCDPYINARLVTELKIIDVSDNTVLYERETSGSTNFMEVKGVVKHDGGDIGRIELRISKSIGEKEIFRTLRAIVILMIIIVLVIIGASIITTRYILHKPLEDLLAGIENLSAGRYDYHFKNLRYVEFNSITRKFEQMAQQIKDREVSLKISEKKYRGLADSLPQVVFEVDKSGNLIYANQNAFDLFKYTEDEMDNGLNVMQMIIKEDHDQILKNMQLIEKGNNIGGVELTAVKHDGTKFPVVIHSNLITHKGKPIGFRGLLIDISERKKMEQDLNRRALAIDHSSDTIVITDTKGSIIYVNPAFEKITGYSRTEALGKNPRILQSGNHDKLFYKDLWKSISSGKTWSGRFINKKKDGSQYTEDATISPVFSDKGKVVNYVAVKRDISEKLKLEDQLQQTQRMETIGTLAGGIAHDFNNILFPIVGHTEMLMADVPDDSPLSPGLNEIYIATLRARDLVKQILTFSRQENSELHLIKMQPIIKEALKLIRSSIPATILIKQNIYADCGVIKADPTKIHQVVMNLATNAYHAMEKEGGVLEVTLKEIELDKVDLKPTDMAPGAYAFLTIADTGTGMDENLTKKIFDPFFTTKEKGKGTGMGLSVVHGIVKSMNGIIKVYSEPGQGTEFELFFPIEKKFSDTESAQTPGTIQGGTEQILLVDDEEAILEMEQQMLERLGYKITPRTSSVEALEAFRANPDKFDLVITDMAMPNMPGDKLSAELTRIRPGIPILLCTGFSETMSEEKIKFLGISKLLMKPIVIKDFSEKIREVLNKK